MTGGEIMIAGVEIVIGIMIVDTIGNVIGIMIVLVAMIQEVAASRAQGLGSVQEIMIATGTSFPVKYFL